MKPVVFLMFLLLSCASAAEYVVRSPEELRTTLPRLAEGDTLRIGPGEYPGGHHVGGVSNLTITALDPERPPVFVGGGMMGSKVPAWRI